MDGSGNAVADIVRIGAVCIGAWSLVDVWVIRLFHVKHKFSEKIVKYKPKAIRKFSVQQFFKNAGSKNFSFACGSLLTANHPKKQLLLSKKSLLFCKISQK